VRVAHVTGLYGCWACVAVAAVADAGVAALFAEVGVACYHAEALGRLEFVTRGKIQAVEGAVTFGNGVTFEVRLRNGVM